jgi:hypothetical protein
MDTCALSARREHITALLRYLALVKFRHEVISVLPHIAGS